MPRRAPNIAVAIGGRLAAASSALVVSLAASPAFALCPNCLGQARSLGPTLRLLGAFLLVPFVIAYVAARFIRRACRGGHHRR